MIEFAGSYTHIGVYHEKIQLSNSTKTQKI